LKTISPLLTIDLGHPPAPADEVESLLLDALTRVRNSPGLHLLKVIHGYGSTGKGGSTREVVRNWLYRHPTWSRMVVAGENYSLFNADLRPLCEELGTFDDPDLGSANPGFTLVWVRK